MLSVIQTVSLFSVEGPKSPEPKAAVPAGEAAERDLPQRILSVHLGVIIQFQLHTDF